METVQVAAEADRLLARVLASSETVAAAAARLLGKGTINPADAEASRAFVAAAAEATARGRGTAASELGAADWATARPLIPIRPERLRMESAENLLAVVTDDIAEKMRPMEDGWDARAAAHAALALVFLVLGLRRRTVRGHSPRALRTCE